jgi:hypothetical protein|tara:strand:- start:229 stop:369 length:141 start_codon:yes stop_codon:yes gene_type:complete
MRMAGQAWFPPANQQGEGCARKPEVYPAQPKPTIYADYRYQKMNNG